MIQPNEPMGDQGLREVLVEMMMLHANAGRPSPLGREDLEAAIAVADRWLALNFYAYAHALPFEADKRLSAADKLLLLATVAQRRLEKVRG